MQKPDKWVSVPEFAKICGRPDVTIYTAIHGGKIKHKCDKDGKILINLTTQRKVFDANSSKIGMLLRENRKILKDPNRTDKSMPEQYTQTAPGTNSFVPLPGGITEDDLNQDDSQSTGMNFLKSRADKEKALARKAKLDADEKEGILIQMDVVLKTWKSIAINVQKSLLAIPDRIAPLIVGETSQFKIREKIDAEIKYALRNLSYRIKNGYQIENEPTESNQ